MLTLLQYPPAFGLPSASQFCTKVEVLLKMSKISYEVRELVDNRKMPHRKMPVVEDDGQIIPDSALIQHHLEKQYQANFYAGLTSEQVSVGHAFARMAEEHLYFATVYSRWVDARNWTKIKTHWFGDIPWPMRNLVSNSVRKRVKRELYGQGLVRHSERDIYAFGVSDIDAIADYLGDKRYFFGSEPSGTDAAIFPIIAGIALAPFPSPLQDAANSHRTLLDYCDRMLERFFDQQRVPTNHKVGE